MDSIRDLGGSPSVALNPHTPAEMVKNVLCDVDHVLVMTVNPGFGGQAYIPTMLEKIKKIRKWGVDRGLDFDIEVDGGVKADWTMAACADAEFYLISTQKFFFRHRDLRYLRAEQFFRDLCFLHVTERRPVAPDVLRVVSRDRGEGAPLGPEPRWYSMPAAGQQPISSHQQPPSPFARRPAPPYTTVNTLHTPPPAATHIITHLHSDTHRHT